MLIELKRSRIGGMKITTLLALVLIGLLAGCDELPKPTTNQSATSGTKAHRASPLHRFENVSSPQSPGIALDTVTGQYCKTWEWTFKITSLNGGLDTLPTCLSIFQSTPSGDNSQ
jgi:hypothetical protein